MIPWVHHHLLCRGVPANITSNVKQNRDKRGRFTAAPVQPQTQLTQPAPWPTPAESTTLASPLRGIPGGALGLFDWDYSPSPARVPFPADDSPYLVVDDFPPAPSPTRSRRSITPSPPPRHARYGSEPDSSPDEVKSALDDEDLDSSEPTVTLPINTGGEPNPEDTPEPARTSTIITHIAPAQTGVAAAPAPPPTMTADMKIIYQRLGVLGRFRDTGVHMSEAEYRAQFKAIVEDATDEMKVKLWIENLAYAGQGWWWHKNLTDKAIGQTLVKKWSTLEPEIEKRWPTPVLNLAAYKRVTREAFESHFLDLPAMAASGKVGR
ncbi:hypothetical protein FRC12_002837 [Ceratobasidium sp. 428]|nr:hypothetical protein FRC12_002837 [Ceratobasidium sp. 428]